MTRLEGIDKRVALIVPRLAGPGEGSPAGSIVVARHGFACLQASIHIC
jgi:hypothetical protein